MLHATAGASGWLYSVSVFSFIMKLFHCARPNSQFLCAVLLSTILSPALVYADGREGIPNKYIFCKPLSVPVPTENEVKDCINKISITWESSWLPAVRSKQKYLITRQNTGSVLQWVGVSGSAAAATLGIADPKNSGTTAIVLGSAAILSTLAGIVWKQEASSTRIKNCTDVVSKQYKVQATLESWYLQLNQPDFRKGFPALVQINIIDELLPGLEKCMPGDWIYQS